MEPPIKPRGQSIRILVTLSDVCVTEAVKVCLSSDSTGYWFSRFISFRVDTITVSEFWYLLRKHLFLCKESGLKSRGM